MKFDDTEQCNPLLNKPINLTSTMVADVVVFFVLAVNALLVVEVLVKACTF